MLSLAVHIVGRHLSTETGFMWFFVPAWVLKQGNSVFTVARPSFLGGVPMLVFTIFTDCPIKSKVFGYFLPTILLAVITVISVSMRTYFEKLSLPGW